MYKKTLFYLALLSTVVLFSSCTNVFNPAPENIHGLKNMYGDPAYAEGILMDAYNRLPSNSWNFTDLATENAVSNDNSNTYLEMATGQWTASNNPVSQWQNGYAAIQYLNIFLANADKVAWATDTTVNNLYDQRMKGEAYGLRGLFYYYLLRAHAGWTGANETGKLLGVPLILHPLSPDSSFNLPRASFGACMNQVYSDLDKAIQLLPLDFGNISSTSQLPQEYSTTSVSDYNRVFGDNGKGRLSGRIAMAIKAEAALLAASPAYKSSDNTTTWADAATDAGKVLQLNGGVGGLAPNGETWYDNTSEINSLGGGSNPPEMLWRTNVSQSSTLEQENYPPTLYGSGLINPTQNLVNAFPMKNGYPITDPKSGYDPSNPYANRDPLLSDYIVVNGSSEGPTGTTINTAADSPTNDGLNKVQTSTRTGFYMRKLLREDVNLNPNSVNTQLQYQPRIRYTTIYLDYAEAANEAWGPTGTGPFSFSAYDVIQAIRQREGITQPDAYLESMNSNQTGMNTLIRNVRRIELCFEGKYFWDLRRWNESLTVPAQGVSITNGNNYQTITVESLAYKDYMRFGPIPRQSILKYSALIQNYGWK